MKEKVIMRNYKNAHDKSCNKHTSKPVDELITSPLMS